jgi:hypothetical protein
MLTAFTARPGKEAYRAPTSRRLRLRARLGFASACGHARPFWGSLSDSRAPDAWRTLAIVAQGVWCDLFQYREAVLDGGERVLRGSARGTLLWGYGHHRRRGWLRERGAPELHYLRDARARLDAGGFQCGKGAGAWMDPNPEDGMMGLKAELVPDAFMQDCDGEAVAGALGRLTRQPLAAFWQSPRAVAWREKPSTYVVCAEDRATPARAQREFAGRADRVVELPTGHHPMLSRPEQLALVLAEAAGRTDDRQCPDTWPATNRRTRPDGRSGTMVGAPARYWP